jgi:hypothetical protein
MKLKHIAAIAVAGFLAVVQGFAGTGPVNANNYDANSTAGFPIYYLTPGNLLNDGTIWVQLYANGTPLLSGTGRQVVDDGLFDFGPFDTNIGDNTSGTFKIEAWKGGTGSTFGTAGERNSLTWTQNTGSYPAGTPPPPPAPATLTYGGNASLTIVPEPATITLGVLGGIALLARRRRE